MTRLRVFCFACILLVLAVMASVPWPPFVQFYLILGVFAGIGFIVFDIIRSRRGRYSLKGLQEFEDREAVRQLIADTPKYKADTVMCPHCMTVYDRSLPTCPQCMRQQKRSL